LKIGIFISGSGTNMEQICRNFISGKLNGVSEISFVLSDKKNAPGIEKASALGINTVVLPKKKEETRNDYENRLLETISPYSTGVIVLAGFMKILGNTFLQGYKGKIINIHPSLLPAFRGVDAQRQAFDYGVKVSGCTVHFVDESLDGGPVILQETVLREPGDTYESFRSKILFKEHKILSEAICIVAKGGYSISDRYVLL